MRGFDTFRARIIICPVVSAIIWKNDFHDTIRKMASFADLTRQLNKKSNELDDHLTTLKLLNDELRDRSGKVLDALTNLVGSVAINQKKTCIVCYSRAPTHAVIPCGHAGFYENCAQRAHRSRCHVCRSQVAEILKIYM